MVKIACILITFCALLISSCSLSNESIIDDEISEVFSVQLMQSAMSQVVRNQSALGGRLSAGVMQYFEEGDFSGVFLKSYNFNGATFNNTWNDGYYKGSLLNLNEMKRLAQKESNVHVEAIANILLAHEYGTLTNMFGDIPMSEALQGGQNFTPVYDTQEDIYSSIIALLEDAIDAIKNSSSDASLLEIDLIYQGNMQGWKKFAFGLKARYLLNLSKKNPSLYSEILEIVSTQSFTSSNDQANFQFNSSFPNPLFQFGIERPSTFFTGAYFLNAISSDPRYAAYTFESGGSFIYMGEPSLTWTQENSTIPLLSYTELKFMHTEVLHLIGTNETKTSELLSEAMQSSFMETVGLTQNALDYIAQMSNLQLLPSSEAQHERIIDEAYKAYYGYSHQQSWNNYRRTGFPMVSTTADTPTDRNPSNIVPRRFPYPISEAQFNLSNLNDAIIRQKGDLLDDDIWIFE